MFFGCVGRPTNGALCINTGGRFYSPAFGRFLSADSLVPRPGDPQSLNRYSYVRNNPLVLVDPSGMADCAAGDLACWQSEWEWKNRWYNAHGWYFDNGHWGTPGAPSFKDVGIAKDVLAEAGIYLSGLHSSGIKAWSEDHIKQMAFGVSLFASRLQGGMAQLRHLLGGIVDVANSSCRGSACAPPMLRSVYFPSSWPIDQVATAFVHELAHVIDWTSSFLTLNGFSSHWGYAPLTKYAEGEGQPYPIRWDRWAEAVTVWVFGGVDKTGNFATNYKTGEVGRYLAKYNNDLNVQMNRMAELLNGWR